MSEIVLGIWDPEHPEGRVHARQRAAAIEAHCQRAGLPKPRFTTPDYMSATVEGCELSRRGHVVTVCGSIEDVVPPQVIRQQPSTGFTVHEWRESWLAYLGECSLAWSSIDPVRMALSEHAQELSRSSIIRSYQRAVRALAKQLMRIRAARTADEHGKVPGTFHGRPPYGYRVIKGRLVPDTPRLRTIEQAFRLVRDGKTISETARMLRQQAIAAARSAKVEFWDPKKVSRILQHARLYCLGEYVNGAGETVTVRDLVVLPPEWVNTHTGGDAAVPRQRRQGTLGAAPTPSAP